MSYELAYLWALRRAGLLARGASVGMHGKAWLCIGHCTEFGILEVTSSHSFHLDVSLSRCTQNVLNNVRYIQPYRRLTLPPISVPASDTNIVIGHVKTRCRTLASPISVAILHQ